MRITHKDNKKAIQQIIQQRQLKSRVPKSAPSKIPRWLFPHAAERTYQNYLLSFVNTLDDEISSTFDSSRFVSLKESFEILRRDSYADDIEMLFKAIQTTLAARGFSELEFRTRAKQVGLDVDRVNKSQWDKILRAGLGVDITIAEPWLDAELQSFVQENADLIISMQADHIKNSRRVILQSVKSGVPHKQLAKEIQNIAGNSKSRAELIARDQVNKFNGRLTELRQTQAGFDEYIWRSADDARVRPEHAANDDKTFSWDDPPSTGHPGQAIRCRCYAEPNFENFYKKLGV